MSAIERTRRATASDLRIEEHSELGDLASAWDAMVDTLPLPTPFLRSWWLGSVAAGEPVFLIVLDGNEFIGGVALQRHTKSGCQWFEMLGDGPLEPDHLDLVAAQSRVADVISAIAGWVRRPGNRVLELRGLVDASWLATALPSWSSARELQVAPFTTLPATMPEYLAGRPGQVRSTIKRSTKRLAGAGITARVRDTSEIDAALGDLRRLHDVRWGDQSSFLNSWSGFAAAMTAGSAAGEVRFTDLVDDTGRVIAIELELIVGRRASFYQAGRLDERELRGSGSVLKSAVIGRLIEDGCTEFDLLRGDESYKTDWATSKRRVVFARVGIGPVGIALATLAHLKRQAIDAGFGLRNRLRAQLDSVTKSISSSTAPTSDGSRSR